MESSSSINFSSSSSSTTTSNILSPSPSLPASLPTIDAADSIKKLPSSQYKGVVPQPNGRWGAQIYEKHRRVWLGTFNLERDAARAYDLAAQRFRGRDAATNFPPLSPVNAGHELSFLLSRSKAEVVDMLRKHTYLDELRNFSPQPSPFSAAGALDPPASAAKPAREHLFEKSVTPSDVGKLNRLVIPKQYAEKHFPMPDGANGGGALLHFEEAGGAGKVWRFRYSYWNSSQSYVLTKGWSRFVKEKGLAAGDSVSFYRSKAAADDEHQPQLYIECRSRGAGGGAQMLRLFGVNIVKAAAPASRGWIDESGKRMSLEGIEMGRWMKKQCVGRL
ncbi:AP2/ERF and B3 domain-containing protein [Platanthera guangdongensis]|uniref:AP2/ERF and B3 domain-containing protein n=1 Tax=Platanthera guangdongensis TaxID=2320717 RepID=A0ABR2M307_9ASPA